MKNLSKSEIKEKIESYFLKEKLDSDQTRKIKNLAMKHKIRLENYRKRFCKKCYSDLRKGKSRISKEYKQVICNICGTINRWKIKTS